jgi:hypothetical protein
VRFEDKGYMHGGGCNLGKNVDDSKKIADSKNNGLAARLRRARTTFQGRVREVRSAVSHGWTTDAVAMRPRAPEASG